MQKDLASGARSAKCGEGKGTGTFWLKVQGNEVSRHMPVKVRLPWKRQIPGTKKCHAKMLSNKFKEKSQSLVVFALILKRG